MFAKVGFKLLRIGAAAVRAQQARARTTATARIGGQSRVSRHGRSIQLGSRRVSMCGSIVERNQIEGSVALSPAKVVGCGGRWWPERRREASNLVLLAGI